MNFKLLFLPLLLLALLLSGCGMVDDPAPGAAVCPVPPDVCDAAGENKYVYDLMHGLYFWANATPALDYTTYATPSDLLAALKYSPQDRWSYITTQAAYSSLFAEGTYLGYGVGVKADESGVWRVYIVYSGSGADAAGLKRGYAVTSLGGVPVADIVAQNQWNTLFDAGGEGATLAITYIDLAGSSGSAVMTKGVVTIPPVYDHRVLYGNGVAVGYLMFTSFNGTVPPALDAAFAAFKAAGVERLVVDLRYNGGGLISTSAYLAGKVADFGASQAVFLRYRHNAAYAWLDRLLRFPFTGPVTADDAVIVITTAATASASEAFINGLRPFMKVTLVGSATHGKPTGMYGCAFCGNVLSAVAFENENAWGQGQYYGGIAADCMAADGLTAPLGDKGEASLAAALYYAAHNACPPTGGQKPRVAAAGAEGAPLTGLAAEAGAY